MKEPKFRRQFFGAAAVLCGLILLYATAQVRAGDINIVSPSPNQVVAGKVKVTALGKPANSKKVRFYADGAQFATARSRKLVRKKWDSRSASSGVHSLEVTAFDKKGNALASSQQTVFVGTGVVISSPTDGAVVGESLKVSCEVAATTTSVDLYVDSVKVASGPPYTFNIPGRIPGGRHTVKAQAFSSGAELGSDAITVEVDGDATPTPTPRPTSTASPSPMPTPAAGASGYYVDPSGRDANSGKSIAAPWKTLTRVNSANLRPGDVVYLKRGSRWRETLIPDASGVVGAPIVFSAYGSGSAPVISGSDLVTGWAGSSGGAFRAPLSKEPANVYVDDAAGWGLETASSSVSMPPGSWYWSRGELFVKLADRSDPSTHRIEAAVRKYGVYGNDVSYVTIDRLRIERTAGWGIEFISSIRPQQTTGIIISNNLVTQNGTGQIDDGSYYNAIYVNQAVAPLVVGNIVSYAGGHNGINVQNATDVQLVNNDVSHFNHSGIDTKMSAGVLYRGNSVHDSNNVSIYSEDSSDLKVENNIVYNIDGNICGKADGVHIESSCTGEVTVYNNSIYNTYCALYLLVPATVKNNAIDGSRGYALRAVSGGRYDYNDLGNGGRIAIGDDEYGFHSWKSLGGHAHDIAADPRWSDARKGNMSLDPASPCIDAGVDVGLEYLGSAPDIGAIESR